MIRPEADQDLGIRDLGLPSPASGAKRLTRNCARGVKEHLVIV